MPSVREVASGAYLKKRLADEVAGPEGPVGPTGPQGSVGNPGPDFTASYIHDFHVEGLTGITVTNGSGSNQPVGYRFTASAADMIIRTNYDAIDEDGVSGDEYRFVVIKSKDAHSNLSGYASNARLYWSTNGTSFDGGPYSFGDLITTGTPDWEASVIYLGDQLTWTNNYIRGIGISFPNSAAGNYIDLEYFFIGKAGFMTNAYSIKAGVITAIKFRTAALGKRVEISTDGVECISGDVFGKYGSGVKFDETYFGDGRVAKIQHTDESVPFFISMAQVTGDYHLVDRLTDPTGPADTGDLACVSGKLKICTVAGNPGVWTIVGSQT